jgi:hypothetical protein
MATSKQPRFPHPPLETGVPLYPTPAVPDFYKKNGHIILVEKISAEKGAYNPQPLDGSVTYKGRDASKWPSTLYLVAQRPTPDGEFVMRYWANDRSLASQDSWNYNVSYSLENPAYPTYNRQYIIPRSKYGSSGYPPFDIGSVDPIVGGNTQLAKQQMVELPDADPLRSRYVAVQVIYETIPGPVITGQRIDARGDTETISVQTVEAGTSPQPDGLLVTQTAVDPIDSIKSKSTYATVDSYKTLTSKSKKPGLLGETITTDNIVDPSTLPDALSTTVLQSTVEAVSATKSRKVTTSSTSPTSLSGNEVKSGLLGQTTTTESIVNAGSLPDSLTSSITSTGVINSVVTPIDAVKSKKTTISSTSPTSLGGAASKSGLLGTTTITETIVDAGSSPDALTSPLTSTGVIDSVITPVDSARSKKTTTQSTGPLSLSSHVVNQYGALETITKQVVNPSTNPDSSYSPSRLLVSDTVTVEDLTKALRETRTMNAYPEDTVFYEVTHDLATVKNTVQIKLKTDLTVPQPSDFVSGITLDINDAPMQFPWVRRTIKSLPTDSYGNPILPPDRIEYNTITYTFPGIIYSWQANLEIGADGKKANPKAQFSFFENRYPVSMLISSKNVITYHVGDQDLSTLNFWSVTTRPWAKIYFNVPDETIHPPAPASLTNQVANRGGVAYAISGGQASNPSVYIPGQELLIGGDCKRWQGNIFMKRLVYVQEPV